jgi:hypothetical protein
LLSAYPVTIRSPWVTRWRRLKMLWGERRGRGTIVLETTHGAFHAAAQRLEQIPRTLEPDSRLIAVIEMGRSSWLIAGIVPGIERHPVKKSSRTRRRCSDCCTSPARNSGDQRKSYRSRRARPPGRSARGDPRVQVALLGTLPAGRGWMGQARTSPAMTVHRSPLILHDLFLAGLSDAQFVTGRRPTELAQWPPSAF